MKKKLKLNISKNNDENIFNEENKSIEIIEYVEPIEVYNNIYLSDYNIIKDIKKLTKNNINHIINCAPITCKNLKYEDIGYSEYDIRDNPGIDILKLLKEIALQIDSLIKENKKIIVHCYKGISRAPTCIMAYLIYIKKKEFDECFELLRLKKDNIDPNMGFLCQLEALQNSL